MFTGIIEDLGEIREVSSSGTNRIFHIQSELAGGLKVDESINHNGICLTIEAIEQEVYRVSAIEETLKKSTAGLWKVKDLINLERAMKLNDRLGGHLVQGHVDATGTCLGKKDRQGSTEFQFQYDRSFAHLIIEKGSICINGVSLTAFNVGAETFTVAIIPYTFDHTNLNRIHEGDLVNLEFDLLGKYVSRIAELR